MTEPVRWGILGAAGILEASAPGISLAENARLVAIASRTDEKAHAAATRYGAERGVEGYDALLADPEIEAVYIPLPNWLHQEWVLKAAAAGKHVLCEKPMAVTATDAQAMIAACASAGVVLGEAYMYAHHPRFDRMREMISAGQIGQPHTVITTFSFDASADLDHSGFQGMPGSGAVYDVGGYAIHSARLLLGAEPHAVTARSTISALHGNIDITTSALVEFPEATLLFHVDMAGADTDTIEVIGAHGRIVVPHAFLCGPGQGDFTVNDHVQDVPETNHYVAQIERFSRAVRNEQPWRYATEEPWQLARALEATSRSYQRSERVPF
ncbi:MAG: Gfo/Idh/MocA family oxidoreductase [Salinibacterium sp.]|nr:Gfo/Idh/MocA family oxidoreductase [Salinibacterium sp.]